MTDRPWHRIQREWPRLRTPVPMETKSTALLVVDMQKDDADRGYPLGQMLERRYPSFSDHFFERIETTVIPNQQQLIRAFRASALRVVYVVARPLLPDGSDMYASRRGRELGSSKGPEAAGFADGATVITELAPLPTELLVTKNSYSPFNSTGIDQELRNLGIQGLVIVGVATDISVDMTARDAADRGYACILVEDACAAFTAERHEQALETFALFLGEVMTTAETLHYLGLPKGA